MGVYNFLHLPRTHLYTIFLKREKSENFRALGGRIHVSARSHCFERTAAGRGGCDVFAEKTVSVSDWSIVIANIPYLHSICWAKIANICASKIYKIYINSK